MKEGTSNWAPEFKIASLDVFLIDNKKKGLITENTSKIY
jgi:hypothetical protein